MRTARGGANTHRPSHVEYFRRWAAGARGVTMRMPALSPPDIREDYGRAHARQPVLVIYGHASGGGRIKQYAATAGYHAPVAADTQGSVDLPWHRPERGVGIRILVHRARVQPAADPGSRGLVGRGSLVDRVGFAMIWRGSPSSATAAMLNDPERRPSLALGIARSDTAARCGGITSGPLALRVDHSCALAPTVGARPRARWHDRPDRSADPWHRPREPTAHDQTWAPTRRALRRLPSSTSGRRGR